jgi:hypothetical protein
LEDDGCVAAGERTALCGDGAGDVARGQSERERLDSLISTYERQRLGKIEIDNTKRILKITTKQ